MMREGFFFLLFILKISKTKSCNRYLMLKQILPRNVQHFRKPVKIFEAKGFNVYSFYYFYFSFAGKLRYLLLYIGSMV